ncbi:MAG TPA: hypothetical protein VK992_02265 [Candidatus Caenarcaniphilales bacterium]|nr:hypothetical protein [Candidatus Caenarcaniphilales bacterium]
MDSRVSSTIEQGVRLEHKHGLDEWSPMLPERSAQAVVIGEEPGEELYRCQRVGCTEVVRVRQDERAS